MRDKVPANFWRTPGLLALENFTCIVKIGKLRNLLNTKNLLSLPFLFFFFFSFNHPPLCFSGLLSSISVTSLVFMCNLGVDHHQSSCHARVVIVQFSG